MRKVSSCRWYMQCEVIMTGDCRVVERFSLKKSLNLILETFSSFCLLMSELSLFSLLFYVRQTAFSDSDAASISNALMMKMLNVGLSVHCKVFFWSENTFFFIPMDIAIHTPFFLKSIGFCKPYTPFFLFSSVLQSLHPFLFPLGFAIASHITDQYFVTFTLQLTSFLSNIHIIHIQQTLAIFSSSLSMQNLCQISWISNSKCFNGQNATIRFALHSAVRFFSFFNSFFRFTKFSIETDE